MQVTTHLAASSSDDEADVHSTVPYYSIPQDTTSLYHLPINYSRFQRQTRTQRTSSETIIDQNTNIVIDLRKKSYNLNKAIKETYQHTAYKELITYVNNSTILSSHNTICTMVKNISNLPPQDRSRLEANKADIARCKKMCTHAFAHADCFQVFVHCLHTIGEMASLPQPTQLVKIGLLLLLELPQQELKQAFYTNVAIAMLQLNTFLDSSMIPDAITSRQRAFDINKDAILLPFDDTRLPTGRRLRNKFAAAGNVLILLHRYVSHN